jgi:CHAT domain-containing protein
MSDVATPALTVRPWTIVAYLCGDNPNLAAHVARQKDAILRFGGSDHFHIALQWDLEDHGSQRAVLDAARGWKAEGIGRVNTGQPERFLEFLRWALDRCPAERVIVVMSGTGLLDKRASVGAPETDRSHLFTVCDDASAGDALSLSELGRMFRQAAVTAARERIDILALDLREIQCLEVAYELEGAVDYLVGPQTRVPDSGWNFDVVLQALHEKLGNSAAAHPPGAAEIATLLVQTVGKAYQAEHHGHLSLSAIDLQTLKNFASAFDTLSLAMMHSVGEELVWEARSAVARKLKPGDPTVTPKGSPPPPTVPPADVDVEEEYLYDLFELLTELQAQLHEVRKSGLFRLVREHLDTLDAAGFRRALESVDAACSSRVNGTPFPSLRDRTAAGSRVRALLEASGGARFADFKVRSAEIVALFTDPALRTAGVHSWLDQWPEEAVDVLEPAMQSVYKAAQRQQQRLAELAAMTQRVLTLLGKGPAAATPIRPLVIAHFSSAQTRHGGVSLYRPRNLDQLIHSDYLELQFNQKIHWTVLLAVINLIGSHPRALWRILSSLLATADNNTRAQIIDRITGPGSVISAFRDQFVVLAPMRACVLSLEPDASGDAADGIPAEQVAPQAEAYRVRLEFAEREAFISETRSILDREELESIVSELVGLLESGEPLTVGDANRLESLGAMLGEDILQELGAKLAEARKAPGQIHLQLQIPRRLMKYPWELMHYKDGWLSEDFAVGRQVFSRIGAGRTRSRVPGPLRALVIGNVNTKEKPLAYAEHEAEEIAKAFEALAAETDGLLEFKRERDALIRKNVTRSDLRDLLRYGNYDIIHFAGHAVFDPRHAGSSGWLLTDGRLTARAIQNTLRWRDTQPWLVYANACEAAMESTAAPASTIYQTDVFGLASAFLDHGVSVFVGPLWRINDRIAARIAKDFYHQLLKERRTVGEALRIAKAEAKADTFDKLAEVDHRPAGRVENVSWAGLVLYGNSTATFGQRLAAPPPSDLDRSTRSDEAEA